VWLIYDCNINTMIYSDTVSINTMQYKPPVRSAMPQPAAVQWPNVLLQLMTIDTHWWWPILCGYDDLPYYYRTGYWYLCAANTVPITDTLTQMPISNTEKYWEKYSIQYSILSVSITVFSTINTCIILYMVLNVLQYYWYILLMQCNDKWYHDILFCKCNDSIINTM